MSIYEGEERRADQHWVLKKEINISIILVLLGQLVMFAVAWGNLENRVTNVEGKVQLFDKVPERLASIEATLISIKERLDRDAR
jgi:hypothetical protein